MAGVLASRVALGRSWFYYYAYIDGYYDFTGDGYIYVVGGLWDSIGIRLWGWFGHSTVLVGYDGRKANSDTLKGIFCAFNREPAEQPRQPIEN